MPQGVRMRAGIRGPGRSGSRVVLGARRVRARFDHSARGGDWQSTQRRGAGSAGAAQAPPSAAAT